MKTHRVQGGGGAFLHVEEVGAADAPAILFLHGFNQCRLAWDRQFGGELVRSHRLVRTDLRGHGLSDKPIQSYGEPRLWADDIAAIITRLELDRPVIVAWSYAGVVTLDYLRHFGTAAIAGVNLVAAVSKVGGPLAPFLGEDFKALVPGFYTTDPARSEAALRRFVDLCFETRPEPDVFDTILGYNMMVWPDTRRALFARLIDNDTALARLDLPTLLTYGVRDRIVLPTMAAHHEALLPRARLSLYDTGHCPFHESCGRFDRELVSFVGECRA